MVVFHLLFSPLLLLGWVSEPTPEELADELQARRERSFRAAWERLYGPLTRG